MSRSAYEEIPGLHLPPSHVPALYKAIDRHSAALAKYLDACQIFYMDPTTPGPAEYLRSRSRITVSKFRYATRAILVSDEDDSKVTDMELHKYVLAEDTKRVDFLRNLAGEDIFPYMSEESDLFMDWLRWQRISTADNKDLEDQVVDVMHTLVNSDNHILARVCGVELEDL
jgi:hypothetical protein